MRPDPVDFVLEISYFERNIIAQTFHKSLTEKASFLQKKPNSRAETVVSAGGAGAEPP
jgi:hypothetical protein